MKCTKCGIIKSENDFYKRSTRSGFHLMCKLCKKNYAHQRYLILKADIMAKDKRQVKERINYLRSLKHYKSCTDCKISYPHYIMDWDHIENKSFGIGGRSKSLRVSLKTLHAELNKCELVCSNCHRARTFKRNHE